MVGFVLLINRPVRCLAVSMYYVVVKEGGTDGGYCDEETQLIACTFGMHANCVEQQHFTSAF